jgi:hypothetical protein
MSRRNLVYREREGGRKGEWKGWDGKGGKKFNLEKNFTNHRKTNEYNFPRDPQENAYYFPP